MKLPINSIKEYTECNLDLDNILSILSGKIGEVEGHTNLSNMYEGIYVGQILTKKEHPDADKLGVYTITIGETEEIQVVAGDKDLNVGNKIAYIKPGYIVPSTYNTSEPFKIKAVKMRGILSNGMLCSEKELNIGPDHSKVLVLEEDAKIGISFSDYYELNDVVIDIENKALTNRGDLFGILGLAREIAGAQNIPFVSPKWYIDENSNVENSNSLNIEVENKAANLCPRYTCITLESVTIKDSPVWLKSILIKCGLKPINNVVDITNYLSIVTGQPLHAFDYDKVIEHDPSIKDKAHITVRLATDGERIHTLDGNIVELNSNHLVIADSTNPIAIAGVIGGIDTEIDSNTRNVIIESANFNKYSIRKTSMELGIFTEAVTRYTKGQHPYFCLPILKKAVSLIEELADCKASSPIVDVYPEPNLPKEISFSISKLNTHLGTTLGKEEIQKILTNIEYGVSSDTKDEEYITFLPPIFRTDIYIPEDIYEDVGRIYGYKNIALRLPTKDIRASKINRTIRLKSKIRSILSNSGCNEIDTYSFTSSNTIQKTKQDPNIAYKIKNSQSPELELMRVSLLISILEKAQRNIQKNISPFCIYEFNVVHQKGYLDNFQLPKEDWHLSLLFSSKENIIDGNPYYQVKRYFEKILNSLGIKNIEYELISDSSQLDLPIWIKNIIPSFNNNGAALIKYHRGEKEEIIGVMGDLDGEVKESFKLPMFTAALEINIELLDKLTSKESTKIEESKYPSITQDICFNVPSNLKYIELENLVLKTIESKERVGSVECIDIYKKGKESKNITLRISIEHRKKTLTDKEFDKIRKQLEEKVQSLNK